MDDRKELKSAHIRKDKSEIRHRNHNRFSKPDFQNQVEKNIKNHEKGEVSSSSDDDLRTESEV